MQSIIKSNYNKYMNNLKNIENRAAVHNKTMWIVLSIYSIINIALLLFVKSGVHLAEGADAMSWYEPALALLKHGSFVMLESPETPMTYRVPMYPLYEATMLWISNGNILSIIFGQIVLLWITGIFAGKIVSFFMPKYKIIALSLVVFNPNALAIAHLIQSDTLYALFIILSAWALLKYTLLDGNKLKWSIITSIFLGISCLIRPTGQYLIFLLPVVFPLLNILYGYKNILRSSIFHGVIGIIVSGFIVFPWMVHNENSGKGYVLVTAQIKTVYLRDNVIWAKAKEKGASIKNASDIISQDEKNYINSKENIWLKLDENERSNLLVAYYEDKLMSYPIRVILSGYIDSWIDFFGGGGSVNFHNLLSIDTVKAMEKSKINAYSSRIDSVFDSLSGAPVLALLISYLSYAYVIILRFLGIFGVIEMIRRKEYALLSIIMGLILYFSITILFVGNSRYRLPVEFGFIILALYGLLYIKRIKN